jgi:hypothetical protein
MKRIYHLIAMLALIHLFALCGFVGYLFSTGRLDRERIEQIAVVLRGEFPKAEPEALTPAAEPPPIRSAEEIARSQERQRFYEMLSDRHQREMEDRRSLILQIKMGVDRELEQVEAREKRLREEQAALRQESEMEGFEKQLEFFSRTDPKQAKELLMKPPMKDADVVQLFMKMEANRVSKIINACKTQAELVWIRRILNQVGQMKAETATGVDGPGGASSSGG